MYKLMETSTAAIQVFKGFIHCYKTSFVLIIF